MFTTRKRISSLITVTQQRFLIKGEASPLLQVKIYPKSDPIFYLGSTAPVGQDPIIEDS
jgi:hypothetical protein